MVTVFLKDETPVAALSFQRRLRTARITPVYLEKCAAQPDNPDLDRVWNSFVAYWAKAERFTKSSSVPDLTGQEVTDAKTRLLGLLYPDQGGRRQLDAPP
jgi:hypothetical protein